MPSIDDYINEIDKWRDVLADELTQLKIYSLQEEKLNTLVPKVLSVGSFSAKPIKAIFLNGEIGIIGKAEEV